MYTAADEATRERRLRRAARRQGFRLFKSHLRDPRAIGYGLFLIADENDNAVAGCGLSGYSMTLDAVEVFLAAADDFDVHFGGTLGVHGDDDRPTLEWWDTYPYGRGGTSGWLLTERADTPRNHFFPLGRTELAQAAIQARARLAGWADDDREGAAE